MRQVDKPSFSESPPDASRSRAVRAVFVYVFINNFGKKRALEWLARAHIHARMAIATFATYASQ